MRAEPNEDAWEALKDAENIGKDARRRERNLQPYSANDDEDTARHEVHVHVHQPSQPDHDSSPQIEIGPLKARNLPKWLIVTLAAIVAAGTALLARLSSR